MTDWVTLLDPQVAAEAPITTGLMTALRDNPIAIAEGNPDAPSISPAAIEIAGLGIDGSFVNATTITGPGFSDFADFTLTTTKTLPFCSVIRVRGDLVLSSTITVAAMAAVGDGHLARALGGHTFADTLGTGFGGSSVGYGGGLDASVAADLSLAFRPFGRLRPLLGGFAGDVAGAIETYGGGSLVLIVEGDCDFTGGVINADGAAGAASKGGGGGGSVIVVCCGQITGGTFRARGGNGGAGANGGGGGYVGLIATDFTGSQTTAVTGGTGSVAGSNGYAHSVTLTRDAIRSLLMRM